MTSETITYHRVTDNGIEQIAQIVADHGKYEPNHEGLFAYAEEIERSLDRGAGACFEIGRFHSRTGNPLNFEIDDDGWETVTKEHEELKNRMSEERDTK